MAGPEPSPASAFRYVRTAGPVVCVILFALCVIVPPVALVIQAALDGRAPDSGWLLSGRQWGLLVESLGLCLAAAALSFILSLPAAVALGAGGAMRERWCLLVVCAAVLLISPLVYVFGWQELLSPISGGGRFRVPDRVLCVLVWAMWGWPIPAMTIAVAWARGGRAAYEAALLETSAPAAFFYGALPLLGRWAMAAVLVLVLLFFGDYSVPHACLRRSSVFATELLGWASSSGYVMDTLWPSLPVLGLTALVLIGTFALGRSMHALDDCGIQPPSVSGRRGFVLAAYGVAAASLGIPMAGLISRLSSAAALVEAIRVYYEDMLWSLGVAILAGGCCVAMGCGVVRLASLRGVLMAVALLLGAVPGALVGRAVAAAYLHVPAIYDHAWVLVLGYTARFGWIGLGAALLAERLVTAEVREQAALDGAAGWRGLWYIRLPLMAPLLTAGAFVVAGLSMGEAAMTALIQVPTVRLVSHVVIEKFHRFEDDILVALSLWIAVSAVPGVLAIAWWQARHGRGPGAAT